MKDNVKTSRGMFMLFRSLFLLYTIALSLIMFWDKAARFLTPLLRLMGS